SKTAYNKTSRYFNEWCHYPLTIKLVQNYINKIKPAEFKVLESNDYQIIFYYYKSSKDYQKYYVTIDTVTKESNQFRYSRKYKETMINNALSILDEKRYTIDYDDVTIFNTLYYASCDDIQPNYIKKVLNDHISKFQIDYRDTVDAVYNNIKIDMYGKATSETDWLNHLKKLRFNDNQIIKGDIKNFHESEYFLKKLKSEVDNMLNVYSRGKVRSKLDY